MTSTDFDYIIIGAGSGGAVLAGRLTKDPTVRVAILEAGPIDNSALIHCPLGFAAMAKKGMFNWNFVTVPQQGFNGRRGKQPRGKVVGGSSSINAMVYIRGQQEDYDDWATQGNAGWSFKDVLPYFKKSETNARGANEWHGDKGPLHVQDLARPNPLCARFTKAAVQAGYKLNPDFNGEYQEGFGVYQVTHKNGERHSVAKGYLTPHLARPNLTLFTDAHACKVLMEGKRAVGIEYLHQDQKKTLHAKREVLLCAGAFQSPQLLMLSGIGPQAHLQEHGIAVVHDLPGVGENLHDHPDVALVYDAPKATDSIGFSLRGIAALLWGVWEWRSRRTGLLTTNFAEGGGFIKSTPDERTPDLQLHFMVGKNAKQGKKAGPGHGFSGNVCVLRPRSRGTLRLASNNPLEAPVIDPNFFGDPDDLQRMVRGVKLLRAVMRQSALSELGAKEVAESAQAESDAQIAEFIRNTADTLYHPVGTCRMGNDTLAVVDAELRVRGVQGLRVVDASIMPSLISGNTNGPVVMIAEKAADLIRQSVL